tara:strand:- start:433 stop:633 length:201 start_codon:yes stop_codon:yes gene_type:complete
MTKEKLQILKARLWDQRIKVRSAIRNQNFQIDKVVTLNELDELILIENEILEEFEKLRTAIVKESK